MIRRALVVLSLICAASGPALADPCPDHFVGELQRIKAIKGDVATPNSPKSPSPGTFGAVGAIDALAGNVAGAKPNLLLGLFMPSFGRIADLDILMLRLPDYASPEDAQDTERARADVLEAIRIAMKAHSIERTQEKHNDKAVLRGGRCDGCNVGIGWLLHYSMKPEAYATGRVLTTDIYIGTNGRNLLDPVMHEVEYLLEDLGYAVGYWRGATTKKLVIQGQACY